MTTTNRAHPATAEHASTPPAQPNLDALALAMTTGVGPILADRLLERFATPAEALDASHAALTSVRGIGSATADRLRAEFRIARDRAHAEAERAQALRIRLVFKGSPDYPPLLAEIPSAPAVLWVKGPLSPLTERYTVAIVGTRRCTLYGTEQTHRFATALTQAGLVTVSGGARGVDASAHRAAVRLGKPTIAVMGCGLGKCYPPEHRELFDDILNAGGCLVSELPIDRPPAADQFPARNRIISGLSLGVLVTEAPGGSGALITARQAVEEHNRDVMAIPGRIDAPASQGTNVLIQSGEAAMVLSPADVLRQLEPAARYLHAGTHADRYARADLFDAPPGCPDAHPNSTGNAPADGHDAAAPHARAASASANQTSPEHAASGRSPSQSPCQAPGQAANGVRMAAASPEERSLVEALVEPLSIDALAERTGLDTPALRSALTMLELKGVVKRSGSLFSRSV